MTVDEIYTLISLRTRIYTFRTGIYTVELESFNEEKGNLELPPLWISQLKD